MEAVARPPVQPKKKTAEKTACYHCGEPCDRSLTEDGHFFCCDGCRFVYGLLKENGLCTYYELGTTPGIKVKGRFASDKFAYLDNAEVQQKLTRFTDGNQTHLNFYLPQMHCASCIWLLENLHNIEPGIISSKTNFGRKEIFISFNPSRTSLRKVVELLAFVGYEPYISLNEGAANAKGKKINRQQIYKIGVAGFAFSNIMMLSFPDYFSSGNIEEAYLRHIFSYVNLLLALPVFFYSASGFFLSAWKGLRQKWLNIDAPIALAILVTFTRSVYEISSGIGPGYLDSMTGIVFFMLVGRWFQDKTFDSFSFDRDYKSYFPLGVTLLKEGRETPVTISALKEGDHIVVRHNELIPADAVLLSGEASIDYSFVSGENTPVLRRRGELIYAGAKQLGGSLELKVVKPVSQSYITQLWNNNEAFGRQKNRDKSFIHPWSRYFTAVLFSIAAAAGLYWWVVNPANILPAVTAALIVACPCSLLLTATFTFGNMLRIFGRNKLYLKNSSVIEALARINTIVFDKTGTLTYSSKASVSFTGTPMTREEENRVYALVKESVHPLSRMLRDYLLQRKAEPVAVQAFREMPGKGIEATVEGINIRLGSAAFIKGNASEGAAASEVWLSVNGVARGCFILSNQYREGVKPMVEHLQTLRYNLHVLSGDNNAEEKNLRAIFGRDAQMQFRQAPQSKLEYIKFLKEDPELRVLMLGDGLNDAGALQQSDVGMAVSEHTSQFTPASDAIMDSSEVGKLDLFLRYARWGKKLISFGFAISILYNIVGLSFAVQASLSPLIAAILMPVSSTTLVSFATAATALAAKRCGLK